MGNKRKCISEPLSITAYLLSTVDGGGNYHLAAGCVLSNRYFILFNLYTEFMNWVLLSQNNTFNNRDSEKLSSLLKII